MNKNLKSTFCYLSIAVLILTKALSSAPIDSLTYYQSFYNREAEKHANLERQAGQLNTKISKINTQINELSNRKNPNWNERRKLSRLTAQKAEINNAMIQTYEKLASQKSTLLELYHSYYNFLTNQIDQILDQYTQITENNQRQNLSRNLIELVEQRTHLLASRRLLFDKEVPPIPEKENLIALVNRYDQNVALRDDVTKILKEKIQQVELLIAAANAENQLRKRLDQLNLEMSALTGEFYSDALSMRSDDQDRSSTTGSLDIYWDNGESYSEKNANYTNWANNANLPASSRPLIDIDYLPIFQKIPTTDLPSYIFELDSLRRYYQRQLQEIKRK